MLIVDKIANYEWDMLRNVNALQKNLSCRNDKYTFFLMRKGQWDVYPDTIKASYLCDIHKAVAEGRNLMVEKYGYMMAETDPAAFEQIKKELPAITPEKEALVEKILQAHRRWYEEAKRLLPETMEAGRTDHPSSPHLASVQTYLRGELYSYGMDTLAKICAYNEEMISKGVNLVIETHKRYLAR